MSAANGHAPASSATLTSVRAIAPAKINLALEVVRRRDDGYHDIDTVMTTINLTDRVAVRAAPAGAGLQVRLDGPFARGIDPAHDLAGRAALAIATAADRAPDLMIDVTKQIPSPAGLGGGSSDAAAVLRALDALWGLRWPLERLTAIAATIGSDVPFFLVGGAAHCTGRGEDVAPLPDLRPLRLLVLLPSVPARPDKTARRYRALHAHELTDGGRARRLAQRLARRAPPPTADLVNAFEPVIERTEPELVAQYAEFAAAAGGAPRLHLCGSGPAVYLFVYDDAKLADLRRNFERAGALVFDARTLGRDAATRVEPIEE